MIVKLTLRFDCIYSILYSTLHIRHILLRKVQKGIEHLFVEKCSSKVQSLFQHSFNPFIIIIIFLRDASLLHVSEEQINGDLRKGNYTSSWSHTRLGWLIIKFVVYQYWSNFTKTPFTRRSELEVSGSGLWAGLATCFQEHFSIDQYYRLLFSLRKVQDANIWTQIFKRVLTMMPKFNLIKLWQFVPWIKTLQLKLSSIL